MSAEEADKTATTDASAGDEEEEWLYGDESESKDEDEEAKLNAAVSAPADASTEDAAAHATGNGVASEGTGEAAAEDVDSDSDSDDDDDDVRVTIGDIKTGAPQYTPYGAPPVNLNIKTTGSRPYGQVTTKMKGVDLDGPGNINGVAVVEADMESFEEKPWRKPGADLSDYFNYGFNEDTWKAYCEKQKRLRMGLEVSTISSGTSKITVQQGRTGNDKDISSLPVHTSKPDFTSPISLYKSAISQVTRISPPQWTGPPVQDMSYYTKSGIIDVIGGQTATISRVEGRRRHNLEGNNITVISEHSTPDAEPTPVKEEEKDEVVEVDRIADVEEEVEEYTCPPMTEWIPDDKAEHFSFLSFSPVSVPSSSDGHRGKPVRSTIVGKFGHSVIIGPNPPELQWEERHRSSTMRMVSPDQLQAHLHCQAAEWKKKGFRPKGKQMGRSMDMVLRYKLQAAVVPWIGNLLIPTQTRLTVADALREQGEKTQLSSTPVFQLLLQTMNVDVIGCREMIEQRKKKVVFSTPLPDPLSVHRKDPRTVAEILQQREKQQELELQHKLILKQLNTLQQQQMMLRQPFSTQQLDHLHQLQNLPPQTLTPRLPYQNLPGLPQMSPLSFPQSVFIPHPVLQPQKPLAPSSLDTSHSSPCQRPPVDIVTSSSPPSPGSTSIHQQTVPLTQSFRVDQSSSPNPAVSVGSTLANQQAVPFILPNLATHPASLHRDHDYFIQPNPPLSLPSPVPKQPDPMHCKSDPVSERPPKNPSRGRKRRRQQEQDGVTSSQVVQCSDGTGDPRAQANTGATQEQKRVRKLSQKARELQKATEAKDKAKKKRKSSPCNTRPHTSRSKEETVDQPEHSTLHLLPGQSIWVMTPGGLVQLAQAQPQPHQQALVPNPYFSPTPGNIPRTQLAKPPLRFQPPPVPYALTIPRHLPAPPTHPSKPLQPVPSPGLLPLPSCNPQPPPKMFLPYKGAVRVDEAEPPPLRREALQFNPSLIFLEPQEAVRDWLSGRGGVVVPGAGVALPYLPPFVSTLSTLSALLQVKKSLTKSSLQLLRQDSEPWHCQNKIVSDNSSGKTSSQLPPDLPDSTSDLRPGEQPAAPSVSSDVLQEEEVLVAAVRELVTECFSSNPAYQLLKARFLSLFTVPALLATIQPITEKTVARPVTQEEEEEEEEEEAVVELKKIKERGRQRAQGSVLMCDTSGAPANHFSGINAPAAD